ncbi:long-chain fatty acid--CoA ligase [Halorubrum laminariae]|uniref:Long-chain fatty acid--CoA ligase n=1 Tax=Halorubrum laminariae TaxID=1433523 RepID=A0ABD6BXU7_9EURY|nr:long-chain fatty acid--CoA ligase [Halorubrum laminariae]
MDVVGDLLARDRRSRDIALVTVDGRERTYRDLITNAYKAANVLRYLGAREGSVVAVDPAPELHTVLAFLGAARLGAPVRFDPDAGVDAGDRVVLVSVDDEPTIEPAPGTNLVAFGGPPERPETTHWEQELWSENPATPPSEVAPEDAVICARRRGSSDRAPSDRDVSHRAILDAAAAVADRYDMTAASRVTFGGGLSNTRAVAAGLVAPLSVGATVALAEGSTLTVEVTEHADGTGATPRSVALDSVALR